MEGWGPPGQSGYGVATALAHLGRQDDGGRHKGGIHDGGDVGVEVSTMVWWSTLPIVGGIGAFGAPLQLLTMHWEAIWVKAETVPRAFPFC